jgi:hypothetical protein
MRDEDESSRYAGVEVEVQKSGIECLHFRAHVTDPAYVVEPSLTTPRVTQPSFEVGDFVVRVACPNRVVIRLPISLSSHSLRRTFLARLTHRLLARFSHTTQHCI